MKVVKCSVIIALNIPSSLFLSFPCGSPIMLILPHLLMYHRFLKVQFISLLFYCSSDSIISMHPSSLTNCLFCLFKSMAKLPLLKFSFQLLYFSTLELLFTFKNYYRLSIHGLKIQNGPKPIAF